MDQVDFDASAMMYLLRNYELVSPIRCVGIGVVAMACNGSKHPLRGMVIVNPFCHIPDSFNVLH